MVLASNPDQPKLKQAVRNSRLSTDSLFGPSPDPLSCRISQFTHPPSLKVKSSITYPAPVVGKLASNFRSGQKKPNKASSLAKSKGARRAFFNNPPGKPKQQQHARQFQNAKASKTPKLGEEAKIHKESPQRNTDPPKGGAEGNLRHRTSDRFTMLGRRLRDQEGFPGLSSFDNLLLREISFTWFPQKGRSPP